MKKVLLAFDGRHFSKGICDFVIQMNINQPVMAVAMFLPPVDYIELLYSFAGLPASPLYIAQAGEADEELISKHISHFKSICEENGITYKIHTDFTKHVVSRVKEETRFADLLVLGSKSFYKNLGEETQDDYITNVLHKAECPVVLIPGEYREPENIILAYDGSEQSVFAIKQFAYMFPEFHGKQALLIYFNPGRTDVPERNYIEELASIYYAHFSIFKLKIGTQKDLEKWIPENGNSILVAGAYGRSLFSDLFRKSFISEIIHDHNLPIFVAHK
jgi:nucleotide-binding universal stress UspA family protein